MEARVAGRHHLPRVTLSRGLVFLKKPVSIALPLRESRWSCIFEHGLSPFSPQTPLNIRPHQIRWTNTPNQNFQSRTFGICPAKAAEHASASNSLDQHSHQFPGAFAAKSTMSRCPLYSSPLSWRGSRIHSQSSLVQLPSVVFVRKTPITSASSPIPPGIPSRP
jgi:hypothetical protein